MVKYLLLVVSLLCLTLWPGLRNVKAADFQAAISEFNAKAAIQSDGSAKIVEVLTLADLTSLNWRIYTSYHDLVVQADGQTLNNRDLNISSSGDNTLLESSKEANTWRISFTATGTLIRHQDRDQFYLKMFQTPDRQIYNIYITVELPSDVGPTDLSGNPYAIGGILDTKTTKPDNKTLAFSSSYAGAQSVYTVSASWPKNVLKLTWITDLRLSLLNLNLLPWLIVGVLLPLIAIFVLLDLIIRQRRNEEPVTQQLSQPSSYLSPILVGVLVNKKIHPNEIVSLIVDLCQRGYLVIIKKNDQYSIGLRKAPDTNLQNWEKEIVDQLFINNAKELSGRQAKNLGSDELFSPQVRDAFDQIYSVVTQMNFFKENPHITRVKYKLTGLMLYFVGAIGLVWVAVLSLPTYLLIPFISLIITSYFIIKLSPNLVRYSREGYAKRIEWLAFRNSLTSNERFGVTESQNQIFEKILPYSIALHCNEEWAKRFDVASVAMIKPDWLITYEDSSAVELTKEITDFTGTISKALASMKGPLVS